MSHPTVRIKPYKRIPLKYKKQREVLNRICFGEDTLSNEEKLLHKDQYHNHKKFLYLLAIEGDRLVGVIGLLRRNVTYNHIRIDLGGLGGLCVAPDKRKQGIGSTLFSLGAETLRKVGCDMVYFCMNTEDLKLVQLYESLGAVLYGKPHSYTGVSGILYLDHNAMLIPLRNKKKFDMVMHGEETFHVGDGNW